jgi:HEAT repeat protein
MNSLGRMKAPEAVPVLTARLSRAGHWIDRMTAARALGFGDDAAGEKALILGLDDPDEAVVLECARSLARRGAADAIPALERRRAKARAKEEYKISRGLGEAIAIIKKGEQS